MDRSNQDVCASPRRAVRSPSRSRSKSPLQTRGRQMQRCGSARQYSRVSSRTDVVQSSAARPMQKCSSSINLSVPENDDEVIMRNPAQPLSNSRLEISSTLSDLKPVDDGLLMSPVSPTGGAKKPVSIVKKKSRAAVDSDTLRRTLMSPRR